MRVPSFQKSDALSEHVIVFQAMPIRSQAEFCHCAFVKELASAAVPKCENSSMGRRRLEGGVEQGTNKGLRKAGGGVVGPWPSALLSSY